MKFRHIHRVNYAECTVGDHVYYGRYWDMLETARGEFFRSLGIPFRKWQEEQTAFPVIECWMRYKTPACYDDVLTIEVGISSMEKVRFAFDYQVRNAAGALVVEAGTTHVCTGPGGKVRRPPEALVQAMSPALSTGESPVSS